MSSGRSAALLAILMLVGSAGAAAAQVSRVSDTTHFGGLSEYSWNFTDPDSIPGFGTLPKDLDTTRLRPALSE